MLLSRFRDILSRCSVGWIPYASRRLIGLLRRKKTLHLACIVTRWKRRATLLSSWRKEPARSSWAKTAVRTPAGESGPGVGVGVGVRVVGVGLWRWWWCWCCFWCSVLWIAILVDRGSQTWIESSSEKSECVYITYEYQVWVPGTGKILRPIAVKEPWRNRHTSELYAVAWGAKCRLAWTGIDSSKAATGVIFRMYDDPVLLYVGVNCWSFVAWVTWLSDDQVVHAQTYWSGGAVLCIPGIDQTQPKFQLTSSCFDLFVYPTIIRVMRGVVSSLWPRPYCRCGSGDINKLSIATTDLFAVFPARCIQ